MKIQKKHFLDDKVSLEIDVKTLFAGGKNTFTGHRN